ncbi:hypothetical protein EJ110_NYTH31556 [Nymphaea thermarum]|nr:hypothetical protein EJ110_NYTH31556 [Nymphaea thermarum]
MELGLGLFMMHSLTIGVTARCPMNSHSSWSDVLKDCSEHELQFHIALKQSKVQKALLTGTKIVTKNVRVDAARQTDTTCALELAIPAAQDASVFLLEHQETGMPVMRPTYASACDKTHLPYGTGAELLSTQVELETLLKLACLSYALPVRAG